MRNYLRNTKAYVVYFVHEGALVNVQMRRFEKIGLTRAQAEQMTEMLTEVVCLNKEKVVQQFVSKPALEKVRVGYDKLGPGLTRVCKEGTQPLSWARQS